MGKSHSGFLIVAASMLAGVGVLHAHAQCLVHEQARITETDAAGGFHFGVSVAISGDVAIVGANTHGSSAPFNFDGPGLATVYRRAGSTWTEQARLTALDAAPSDWFGIAVAIEGDLAIVGALGDDNNGSAAGAAYIFHFDGTQWTQQAKLVASDGTRNDEFGAAVAISGQVAVVGAPQNSRTKPGAAYVYRFDGAQWIEEAKLTGSDSGPRDEFGISVAIRNDVAAVGAWNHGNSGQSFPDGMGAAYVYRFAGGTWAEESKLGPSNVPVGQRDRFGKSVALDEAGTRVAVATEAITFVHPSPIASAYVFTDTTEGDWLLEAKLIPADAAYINKSIAISGDTIIAGAWSTFDASCPFPNICNSGSAFVFRLENSTWVERATLKASDRVDGDTFGWAVGISGGSALIGNWRDGDAGIDAGAAYFFAGLGDCNGNSVLDACDIAAGTSADANANSIPDECECLADLTGSADPTDPTFGIADGIVDANDFFFYLGLFAAGDLAADLTGSSDPNSPDFGIPDGTIDANDFFFYLGLFAQGCN